MLAIQKLLTVFFVASLSFMFAWSTVQAADENQSAYSTEGMSYAMQKSMDPNVWSQMMAMMMDPSSSSAMANCALCHEGEDLARYQEQFGPMMDAAFSMYKSMSPQQMMGMMGPMMNMMNPAMYMGMMGPMMGMMNPMMMGPMMGMMNPMMMGSMMGPMMGMMNPMTMMNPMNMMNPMSMMGPMMGGAHGGNSYGGSNPMTSMMNPGQYEQWFNQMTEMMQNFAPKATQ